jgi:hypothetical protein
VNDLACRDVGQVALALILSLTSAAGLCQIVENRSLNSSYLARFELKGLHAHKQEIVPAAEGPKSLLLGT